MVVCLLLLGAGVTAATSAFLGRQGLQAACDGAAASSVDATLGQYYGGVDHATSRADAEAAAMDYLRTRRPAMRVAADPSTNAIRLTCTDTVSITFGSLFGVPTLSTTVEAVGRVSV